MTAGPIRRPIPLSVKLDVALRALGLKPGEINWSHEPALELRPINDDGSDWKPGQHDPDYLFLRSKPEHDRITFKDNGTGRGDLTAIAHTKRLVKRQQEHGARIAARVYGEPAPVTRPKRKIASRGFSPGHRKLQSRGFQRRQP